MLIDYLGGMKFVARHRGLEVISDQPRDGGGEDTAMTPAELFVASLGMCVGVYVVGYAQRHAIPVEGMKIEMDYETGDTPKRVTSIEVRARLPQPVEEAQHKALQRVAEQCLVHTSLTHPPHIHISVECG